MCLRRAPEKYIAGAALDRADVVVVVASPQGCELHQKESNIRKMYQKTVLSCEPETAVVTENQARRKCEHSLYFKTATTHISFPNFSFPSRGSKIKGKVVPVFN
jgi:hypothetical protein